MCAQLVAAGMFPPSNAQKWGSYNGLGQEWQPIDFDYTPMEQDDASHVPKTMLTIRVWFMVYFLSLLDIPYT